MSPVQSNTIRGSLPFNSSESLVGKEGYLVALTDGGSIPELFLPTAVSDLALYVVTDGNAINTDSDVQPLGSEQQTRIVAKGTGSAGGVLALANPSTPADKGKVRAIPATAGVYFSPGIAEEDWVDGQYLRIRPCPRLVTVTDVVTAPAAATSTNGVAALAIPGALTSTNGVAAAASGDLANLAAEAEKIGDDTRAIHAAVLLAQAENEKISDDARAALASVAALRLALITAKVIAAS